MHNYICLKVKVKKKKKVTLKIKNFDSFFTN